MPTIETPILDSLIESGAITLEDGEYIGHASDGVAVLIGSPTHPEFAELYLTEHPTPDTW